jgi:hydroxymethylbilane synthase
MSQLIIGTRGSPLALAQTHLVARLLREAHIGLQVEVRIIKTSGDRFQQASLAAAGGKGLFTKEIEDELLAGNVHLAVHSLKDLPTTLPAGLGIGAVLQREDPRDVLVTREPLTIAGLPPGARIATSSIRRKAQLLAARPDLDIVEIRGNVDTRLRKLGENQDWAATVLAAAGLNRLNITPQWPQYQFAPLPLELMIPAVGQGAIACECRIDDTGTNAALAALDHANTRCCVEAERAFLHAIGGGCQLPFAAHAEVAGNELNLTAARFSPVPKRIRVTGVRTDPHALGQRAAAGLS